jgi:hypothetical protein
MCFTVSRSTLCDPNYRKKLSLDENTSHFQTLMFLCSSCFDLFARFSCFSEVKEVEVEAGGKERWCNFCICGLESWKTEKVGCGLQG